jgi:hypothetical protein
MDKYRLGKILDDYFMENPGRSIIEDMESSEEIINPDALPTKIMYDNQNKFFYAEFRIGKETHCVYRNDDNNIEFTKMALKKMEDDVKEKVFSIIQTRIQAFDYEPLILTEEKLNRKI